MIGDPLTFTVPGHPQGLVYKITNKLNGKAYIGVTRQPLRRRLRAHRLASMHEDTVLYRAVRLYGWDGFTSEIICVCSIAELPEMERRQIAAHRTHVRDGGYNMTAGGEGSPDICEETRSNMRAAAALRMNMPGAKQKISETLKGRAPKNRYSYPTGVPLAEERKLAISRAKTGKPLSEAHKAAIAATLKAKHRHPKPEKVCVQRSEINARIRAALNRPETRQRLSDAHRRNWAKRKAMQCS